MSGRRFRWRDCLAAAAMAVSGAVAALAGEAPGAWSPDPDEQYLLDVNIRQFRMDDGVRAYNTPSGPCVVFGDFVKALDLPIQVDLAKRKATGWAIKEANRIEIDLAGKTVRYGGKSEPIAHHSIRETGEGWCVDTAALARWIGVGVKPVTSASALFLESEAKLPFELAAEREKRAARLARKAKFDIGTLPKVKLPYRMWRAPALDFVVSGGVTYRAKDGVKVDRQSAVYGAGEIARLSYSAQMSTDAKGRPALLRLHTFRSDPEGGLLGPLKATHFGAGDVEGFNSSLTGATASGRGAVVTNRPLLRPTAFGATRFEGDLPAGWEAELYRNGELLAFSRPTGDQRYLFDNVELQYGDNDVTIMMYGPQGQVRTRVETINIGQDNVPAGKTWYWAGANQPGRNLVSLQSETGSSFQPKMQAAVSVEHGLDNRTSVGALARTMLMADDRLTFVEGTVRRSIGGAVAELAGSYDSKGGMAVGAEVLGKVGAINLRAKALATKDFRLRGGEAESIRDVRLTMSVPVKLGIRTVPVNGSMRYFDNGKGGKMLEAAARMSASIERFNLSSDVKYRRNLRSVGVADPPELDWSLIGSGRVRDIRLRGGMTFGVLGQKKLRSAELSAYWSASDIVDWEGGLLYDADRGHSYARVSHVRRLSTMAIGVSAEAGTDGALAFGLNLNFSLDPHRLSLSRHPLASAGAVRAHVYRDENANGAWDAGEPEEKGVQITTGTRLSDRKTGADGKVVIGGLTSYQPIAVGIDESTLSDPMLASRKALQVVIPRPGVPADVEIGLVGSGAVEGAVVKSGGIGIEGLDLELVDAAGKVVATARSDFDGFLLFEKVPYGGYKVRISKASAEVAKLAPELGAEIVISADRTVARMGSIHVVPLPQIAAATP